MLDLNFEQQVKADICNLFSRLPVMEVRQFLRSLYLMTGLEANMLNEAYKRLASKGRILVSANGYVTTKNAYNIVSEEDIPLKEGGLIRLGELPVNDYFLDCIQCYNIILDLYPVSKEFYLERDLFHIAFADMEKDRIFEIIRIPAGKELLYQSLLIKESSLYTGEHGELIRNMTRRIALTASEETATSVPFCGFTHICVPDSNEQKGFRIIEKRKGNLWKDAIIV